jgi:hypothetical protein
MTRNCWRPRSRWLLRCQPHAGCADLQNKPFEMEYGVGVVPANSLSTSSIPGGEIGYSLDVRTIRLRTASVRCLNPSPVEGPVRRVYDMRPTASVCWPHVPTGIDHVLVNGTPIHQGAGFSRPRSRSKAVQSAAARIHVTSFPRARNPRWQNTWRNAAASGS